MKKKLKKITCSLIVFAVIFVLGCSSTTTTSSNVKTKKNIKLPKKVVVGVINVKTLPPQPVYGFQKGLYKKAFPGVDFKLELSEGHCDVAENMADSNWDILYISTGPSIEFVNYGYQKWKPAQYTILAGAQNEPSILMAKPEIKNLRDLAGKTVGITNKSIDKEMVLNSILAKEGMKTASIGGNVSVKYGEPVQLYNDYLKGNIQAFYPMPSMIDSIKRSGGKMLSDGSESEFGKSNLPFSVMAVSNRFLAQYQDFVKEMVGVHVDITQEAKKNSKEMVDLTYDLENKYFKGDEKRVLMKADLEKLYKKSVTTYDPNNAYLKDSYQLLVDAKYLQAMPAYEKWVNLKFLNEVLKEKGLKTIALQ